LWNPGFLKNPYETVFGLLSLKDLASLYEQHGKRLITANIRAYKGDTEVNEQILSTIQAEPEHFFYLNNGLTAYCDRLKIANVDRGNTQSKRITVYGLSIVNGAQTLGAVAKYFRSSAEEVAEGFVFIKVVSLWGCENDRAFAARITRSTNFQNQIGARDFVAQDEQQARIAKQLLLSGIAYHYRDDADIPASDGQNFSLDEATTASACLAKAQDCHDFCARIIANRKSLWSMEDRNSSMESRYERVFRADRSARTLWRAVQTQRLVIQVMSDSVSASSGVRKAFFTNARWVILSVIFVKLRSEQGNDLSLTAAEIDDVSQRAIEFSEQLWTLCEEKGYVSRQMTGEEGETVRSFRSVFSNAADCQSLRGGLLAKLAQS
jgi:hypothetical protein